MWRDVLDMATSAILDADDLRGKANGEENLRRCSKPVANPETPQLPCAAVDTQQSDKVRQDQERPRYTQDLGAPVVRSHGGGGCVYGLQLKVHKASGWVLEPHGQG